MESQQTICAWADQAFGGAPSTARIAARANEEMAELLRAVTSDAPAEKIAEEAADVIIVLMRVFANCGADAQATIDAKMAKNRERQWHKDGTGHGYHVRDKQPVAS